MIYICEECGFLFSRMGEIRECPSCEKHQIRPADREEAQRLQLSTGAEYLGVKLR